MTTIRPATMDDIPALLDIGRRFVDYTKQGLEFSLERVEATLAILIDGEDGAVLVGEKDGQVAGVIVGAKTPTWYSSTEVASEMALWVDPGNGRLAFQLICEFENWAKDRGVSWVSMSDLCIDGEYPAGRLFHRKGYRVVERFHLKEV